MKLDSNLRFSLCCCVSRRGGTLIVGIGDVILGILCVLATVALLAENLTEQATLRDMEISEENAQELQELIAGFILVLIACGIPSLITFATGVVSIYATRTQNSCLSAYSVALNCLLAIGLIGIDIFLYWLGLRMSLLIVYLTATVLQIYFALIIFDFYTYQQQRVLPITKTQQQDPKIIDEARKLPTEP